MTVALLALGSAGFLAMEWSNTLKDMSLVHSLTASFFQSVTCRTAGFNTVDIAQLRESTLFMMIFLMFIGGSPGSIAGGIKTTTMFVVLMLLYSKLKGINRVNIFGRSLENDTVDRSITLFILAIMFVSLTSFILIALHTAGGNTIFLSMVFETVSAFGTVGLSMGMTGQLNAAGKAVVIVVMLAGRLGLLTILMALTLKKKRIDLEYPREHIMIG
jgi:trk system potassium uptake protein TrkH